MTRWFQICMGVCNIRVFLVVSGHQLKIRPSRFSRIFFGGGGRNSAFGLANLAGFSWRRRLAEKEFGGGLGV